MEDAEECKIVNAAKGCAGSRRVSVIQLNSFESAVGTGDSVSFARGTNKRIPHLQRSKNLFLNEVCVGSPRQVRPHFAEHPVSQVRVFISLTARPSSKRVPPRNFAECRAEFQFSEIPGLPVGRQSRPVHQEFAYGGTLQVAWKRSDLEVFQIEICWSVKIDLPVLDQPHDRGGRHRLSN